MQGKGKIILIVSGVIVLAILICSPIAQMILGMILGIGQMKGVEAKLRRPAVYEPVARTLAMYCQSEQGLFPEYLSYAWLPEELAQVGHGRCRITTNYANVEMGGGFYHFGYRLVLDNAASTTATNAWQLLLYREERTDTHLMTLALAATQQVARETMAKMVVSGFDEALKKGNDEAYKGKVLALLRFGNAAAAARTCQEWIRHKPDFWLPRFTYAHIRCRLGDTEPASAEFSGWIQAHKNFAHCIYLALFQLRESRTNEALKGVRLALEQPFVESFGTEGNKFYLGQNSAVMAYAAGDYNLCLAMCDKMLAEPKQEKWWKRKILHLKAGVLFMKKDQASALELVKYAEASADSSAFSAESVAKTENLRTIIEKKNIQEMKAVMNWVDDLDTWFSPFETDEAEIHGDGLNLPTPYPKSWKTERMNPQAEK